MMLSCVADLQKCLRFLETVDSNVSLSDSERLFVKDAIISVQRAVYNVAIVAQNSELKND